MDEDITNILINRAVEKARSLGVNVCIAVVDDGAILTGLVRMNGAFKGSVDVAIGKARTAALFPFPTEQFGEVIRKNHLAGLESSNGGLMCFAGGCPVYQGSIQVGAIGISGGSAEQDAEIARHSIESI